MCDWHSFILTSLLDIQNEELTQSDYNRVSFDIASSSNSSSKSDAAVKNLAGSSASTATSDIDTRTKSILEKVMDVLKEWITDKTLVHMGLAEEKIQVGSSNLKRFIYFLKVALSYFSSSNGVTLYRFVTAERALLQWSVHFCDPFKFFFDTLTYTC